MNAPAPETSLQQLIRRLRQLEIRIRKVVDAQLQGDFHSVFKGTGLEFDDVRLYQYGDEVRAIDWAVSAKGHGTFVKTYKEEREQSVLLLLDVSRSQLVGAEGHRKLDVARDICGILALSAARQDAQLGVLAFSDQKELYLPPGKGIRHAYALIKSVFGLQPTSAGTNVAAGIRQALALLKRRTLVLLLSDFIDVDFERELTMLARKHDLVVVQLLDQREREFPPLGIVPLRDQETGRTVWVNTSSKAWRARYRLTYEQNRDRIGQICRRQKTAFLSISTDTDYVPQLVNLFRLRNRRGPARSSS
ncbi:DUF58 domain-containing protein [Hymenobacter busanensis]|uniref:DUF58 domain-containing protein n=1 Tax=Hymenobacter busanensis TaxID=2607656 RepID=A0A7L4ZRN6_9BACT|nr:DUF58 domain-containing protein [Hymenobacter busanensis]KAA9327124.1 DUF58 domain-containing protein [Hymenobacter busanensis]QHJ05789.1 DUF58 domain-containing protein [Hymenobacter busanensis]